MEAYWGTTPRDWEECTLDQIYISLADTNELSGRWGGRVNMTPTQARSKGMIPEGVKLYEGGMSYAMRLRQKRLEKEREGKEDERTKRKREREKRREEQRTGKPRRKRR